MLCKIPVGFPLSVLGQGAYTCYSDNGEIHLCRVVGDNLIVVKTCNKIVALTNIEWPGAWADTKCSGSWFVLVRYDEQNPELIKHFDLICISNGQVMLFEENTAECKVFSERCLLKAYQYSHEGLTEKVFLLFEINSANGSEQELHLLSYGDSFEVLRKATKKAPALYALKKPYYTKVSSDLIKVFGNGGIQVVGNVYDIKRKGSSILARFMNDVYILWRNEPAAPGSIAHPLRGNVPGVVHLGEKNDKVTVPGVNMYESRDNGWPILIFLHKNALSFARIECKTYDYGPDIKYSSPKDCYDIGGEKYQTDGFYPCVLKIDDEKHVSLHVTETGVSVEISGGTPAVINMTRKVKRLIEKYGLQPDYVPSTLADYRKLEQLVLRPSSGDKRCLIISNLKGNPTYTVCFADGEVVMPLGVKVTRNDDGEYDVHMFYEGGRYKTVKW